MSAILENVFVPIVCGLVHDVKMCQKKSLIIAMCFEEDGSVLVVDDKGQIARLLFWKMLFICVPLCWCLALCCVE